MDLPLRGATFTWTDNQTNRASNRLDHFLFTDNWLKHTSFSQEALPGSGADHIPILFRPCDN